MATLPHIRAWLYRISAPHVLRQVGRGALIHPLDLPVRPVNATVGAACRLGRGVHLATTRCGAILLGERTTVGAGTHLVAHRAIAIGADVVIGEHVSIRDQEPRFVPSVGTRGQGFRVSAIVIEDRVIVERGVSVRPGTHLRSGTVVAANSVVSGSFPPNVFLAGAPATVRRLIGADGARRPIPDNVHLMAERTASAPPPPVRGDHAR